LAAKVCKYTLFLNNTKTLVAQAIVLLQFKMFKMEFSDELLSFILSLVVSLQVRIGSFNKMIFIRKGTYQL